MTKNKSNTLYQDYINDLKENSLRENESRFVAKQLLSMLNAASKRKSPTILELGVDRGQSTKVFLHVIDKKSSGHLFSVDIKDCSKGSKSNFWTFIQKDSTDIKGVLKEAPILEKGIDIIYVDSLHTPDHVYKEIYGWFPFLKRGGYMYFDDIDAGPYQLGMRKDNASIEFSNRKIFELIEAVFQANLNIVDLDLMRGSTGLACLKKISGKGSQLQSPKFIRKRNNPLLWKLINTLLRRTNYKHSPESNKSFLIDVTKYKD